MNATRALTEAMKPGQSMDSEVRRVAVSGANGFVGLHVRAALLEEGLVCMPVAVGERFDKQAALEAVEGAEALLHIAGVNRGSDEDVAGGNLQFAAQLSEVLREAKRPPERVAYANSIQAGNGTVYGSAKLNAGTVLESAANDVGSKFNDIALPNLFGEYGKPFYNSVVATFSHQVAKGDEITIEQDNELTLLHVADAADVLLGLVPIAQLDKLTHRETVSGIAYLLREFGDLYGRSEFPDLSTNFRRNLFNTYRSYLYPQQLVVDVTNHRDHRGGFFEITRSRGGTGQTSMSTTCPGISRGDHFHRRKVERFTVVSGTAEISLRRFDQAEVQVIRVSGENPISVDMPTLVAHQIRNVGQEVLNTVFWTNDIFDPSNPDTIAEVVI